MTEWVSESVIEEKATYRDATHLKIDETVPLILKSCRIFTPYLYLSTFQLLIFSEVKNPLITKFIPSI